jgi:hypothetical protein
VADAYIKQQELASRVEQEQTASKPAGQFALANEVVIA